MPREDRSSTRKEQTDRTCEEIAAAQFGVIGRAQLIRAGVSPSSIERRVIGGRIRVIHPGVYVFAGVPASDKQALIAAARWAGEGAVVSHRGAAFLWRLDGVDVPQIEVTALRRRRSKTDGVVLHTTDVLPPCDVAHIGAIPVTAPARTVVDLGAVIDEEALALAVEDALRRRLMTLARLRWRIDELCGRGRRGCASLRRVLELRGSGAPSESPLETKLARLLARHRLPPPARQFEVREGGRLVARVDFAYPRCKLAIEVDGYRFHSGRSQWEKDLSRRNRLSALGWIVLHVTADQMRDPAKVAGTVKRFLSSLPSNIDG